MLGYSTIAAGNPSDMAALSGHLLTQTIPQSVADLARYYQTGGAPADPEIAVIEAYAREVLDGDPETGLLWSEALAELTADHTNKGPPDDPHRERELGAKLDAALARMDEGTTDPSVAELRPDLHPLVAKGLGLTPGMPLTRDNVNALLAGRRADGEKIEGKRYIGLRQATNERTGEVRELVPLGSVDFTLTPDKSVSLAWAFGPPAEQAAIFQAHIEAADQAMAFVLERVAVAKVGAGGNGGYEPGHVAVMTFDHYAARPTLTMAHGVGDDRRTERFQLQVPGDPNLHRHHIIPNAVFTESGRVGSLSLHRLDGIIKQGGALYQAHLATKLRKLGADVMLDPKTGMARMTAIPEHARDHFSKKTKNGEIAAKAYAKAQGYDWDRMGERQRVALLKAAIQPQNRQGSLDPVVAERLKKDDFADFGSWHAQAAEIGWVHQSLLVYGPPPPPLDHAERNRRIDATAAPYLEAELDRRAVVMEHDVRTAALRGMIAHGIEDNAEVGAAVERWMEQGVQQQGQRTSLIAEVDTGPWRTPRYTTALHERQEAALSEIARALYADQTGALTKAEIGAAVEGASVKFTDEQTAAIYRTGTGGRLTVLVGAAGFGKNTSLEPLVAAWTASGHEFNGGALSWKQSDDLNGAGIPQCNLKALSVLMAGLEDGSVELGPKSIVVIDEVSLLGSRHGLALLAAVDRAGARVILMGDAKQMQSIDASPILGILSKALGPDAIPEVTETQRQQSPHEKTIVRLMRAGRVDKMAQALDMKRADGTAEMVPGTAADAIQRVACLFGERLVANAGRTDYSIAVSAPSNADAHAIGAAIRTVRRSLGQVGEDKVTIRAHGGGDGDAVDLKLASGDRVRLFKSVAIPGVRGSIGRNGSVLEVLDANANGIEVRNEHGQTGFLPFTRITDRDGKLRLAYGDVLTTHSAQGSTATEHIYALVNGSGAVDGFAAYSSGTRHRERAYLITSEGAERAQVSRSRPMGDMRPITKDDAWANVARNLGQRLEKQTATDFLGETVRVRRGAARVLQAAAMRQPGGWQQRLLPMRDLGRRLAEGVATRAIEASVDGIARAAEARRVLTERVVAVGERMARGMVRTPAAPEQGPRVRR